MAAQPPSFPTGHTLCCSVFWQAHPSSEGKCCLGSLRDGPVSALVPQTRLCPSPTPAPAQQPAAARAASGHWWGNHREKGRLNIFLRLFPALEIISLTWGDGKEISHFSWLRHLLFSYSTSWQEQCSFNLSLNTWTYFIQKLLQTVAK